MVAGAMNVASPHRAVVAGLDGDVLVLLAGMTQPLSGREVADRLGQASHEGVRKSLERLAGQGIVHRAGTRSAYMHTLNLAAPAVLALAAIRTQLWARLRQTLEAWEVPAVHASAFGSAARGDGDERSDIDIFVVRSAAIPDDDRRWVDQIEALRSDVEAWTGNPASIVEQDEDVLAAALTAARPPAVLQAIREGIDLGGVPIHRLAAVLGGT